MVSLGRQILDGLVKANAATVVGSDPSEHVLHRGPLSKPTKLAGQVLLQ
jgi:hypothetical protein